MNQDEGQRPQTPVKSPFSDDGYLPMSGLQHLLFCPRQCSLIHVEGIWQENVFTVEGRFLHERVDTPGTLRRNDIRVARRVWLRSERLRLVGIADVVEFHRRATKDLAGRAVEVPFPVEYKRGSRKKSDADKVQLCAQAMALEEALGTPVPAGALFYGQTQRRVDVQLDTSLRSLTQHVADEFHRLIDEQRTPPAVNDSRCPNCSLREKCQPGATSGPGAASRYLQSLWRTGSEEPT